MASALLWFGDWRDHMSSSLSKFPEHRSPDFLIWGKVHLSQSLFSILKNLTKNFLKVWKLILWVKNSVWRRLRRAKKDNKRKARFWKVDFDQFLGTQFFSTLREIARKNTVPSPPVVLYWPAGIEELAWNSRERIWESIYKADLKRSWLYI